MPSVGRRNSMRVDVGRRGRRSLLAIKIRARIIVWGGVRGACYCCVTPDLSYATTMQ